MLCVISTKTTGLKPEIHEVIELNIKPFGLETVTFKVRPDNIDRYEENVQKINGLSKEIVAHFPTKEQCMESVLKLFQGVQPIGHYFVFDYKMLHATFGQEFLEKLFAGKVIDTATLVTDININCINSGQPKRFKKDALKAVAADLEIPFTSKCEVIEQVYKKLVSE